MTLDDLGCVCKVVIKTYVVFYINVKNVTLIYVKNVKTKNIKIMNIILLKLEKKGKKENWRLS